MEAIVDQSIGQVIIAALQEVDEGGMLAVFIALPNGKFHAGLYPFDDPHQSVCADAAMSSVSDAIKVYVQNGYFVAE